MGVLRRRQQDKLTVEQLTDPAWSIQPGETDKAFAAFCVYRDLSPSQRSVINAYVQASGASKEDLRTAGRRDSRGRRVPQAPTAWRDWACNNLWTERARRHDADRDRRRLQEHDEVRQRVIERLMSSGERVISEAVTAALAEEYKNDEGRLVGGASPGRVKLLTYLIDHIIPKLPQRLELAGPAGGPIETSGSVEHALPTGLLDQDDALAVLAIIRETGALGHLDEAGDPETPCDDSTPSSSDSSVPRLRRSAST